MGDQAEHYDFFVSYNRADVKWATWIAWLLEQAKYDVIIQAWDFRPGNNFALEMDRAAAAADRTIAVLSPSYLASDFTQPEWAAAMAGDPRGTDRALIPVRVEPCDVEGLLNQVIFVDLVGRDDEDAAQELLAGVAAGRAKPLTAPPFPGPKSAAVPLSPKKTQELWRTEPDGIDVLSRAQALGPGNRSVASAVVELYLVPLPPQRLEVRRLATLDDELAKVGRDTGLFEQSQPLTLRHTDQFAAARSDVGRAADDVGILVSRTGQRSVWLPLPRDSMGAVLDPSDLIHRLAAVLRMIMSVDIPMPERFGVALALGPLGMVTNGDVGVLGRRTSAQMIGFSKSDIFLGVEDSFAASSWSSNLDSLVEEVVARLLAAFQKQ